MTTEKVCPVCKTPVDAERGVYRIGEEDYHRECYEKSPRRKRPDSESERADSVDERD